MEMPKRIHEEAKHTGAVSLFRLMNSYEFAMEHGFKAYCANRNGFALKEVNFGATRWSPRSPLPRFHWVYADPSRDEAHRLLMATSVRVSVSFDGPESTPSPGVW